MELMCANMAAKMPAVRISAGNILYFYFDNRFQSSSQPIYRGKKQSKTVGKGGGKLIAALVIRVPVVSSHPHKLNLVA
jgi:hypothetical protein